MYIKCVCTHSWCLHTADVSTAGVCMYCRLVCTHTTCMHVCVLVLCACMHECVCKYICVFPESPHKGCVMVWLVSDSYVCIYLILKCKKIKSSVKLSVRWCSSRQLGQIPTTHHDCLALQHYTLICHTHKSPSAH